MEAMKTRRVASPLISTSPAAAPTITYGVCRRPHNPVRMNRQQYGVTWWVCVCATWRSLAILWWSLYPGILYCFFQAIRNILVSSVSSQKKKHQSFYRTKTVSIRLHIWRQGKNTEATLHIDTKGHIFVPSTVRCACQRRCPPAEGVDERRDSFPIGRPHCAVSHTQFSTGSGCAVSSPYATYAQRKSNLCVNNWLWWYALNTYWTRIK